MSADYMMGEERVLSDQITDAVYDLVEMVGSEYSEHHKEALRNSIIAVANFAYTAGRYDEQQNKGGLPDEVEKLRKVLDTKKANRG